MNDNKSNKNQDCKETEKKEHPMKETIKLGDSFADLITKSVRKKAKKTEKKDNSDS